MTHIRQQTRWSVLAAMSFLSTKYKHWINVVASVKLYSVFCFFSSWMNVIPSASDILSFSVRLKLPTVDHKRTHHFQPIYLIWQTKRCCFFFHVKCMRWFIVKMLLLKFDFIELSRAFSVELFINERSENIHIVPLHLYSHIIRTYFFLLIFWQN